MGTRTVRCLSLLLCLQGAAPWCCRACGKCMCKVYGFCPPPARPDQTLPASVQLWTPQDVAAFVRSISVGGAQQTCPANCPLLTALNAGRFEQRGMTGRQLEALFAAFATTENATRAEARAEKETLAAVEGGGNGINRSANKLKPNASKRFDAKLRLFASNELRGLLPEGETGELALQVLVRLRDALAHRHGGNGSARRLRMVRL
jgi:hypothetical protein